MTSVARRLREEALGGDVRAARRLRQHWVRHGLEPGAAAGELLDAAIEADDAGCLAMLTAAFTVPEMAAARLATLWAAGDTAMLEAALRAFGVVFGGEERTAVEARLDRATQTSDVASPLALPLTALLCAALDPDGIGWTHLSPGPGALVALAVVRRARGVVVLGLGTCAAAGVSPGRVWRALQPWREDSASLVNRCASWTVDARPDRIVLPWVEPCDGLTDALALAAEVEATRDPLDLLLDEPPSRSLFGKIARHVDGLEADAASAALARAATGLATWSHALRLGGSRWLGQLAAARRRGAHGLGLQLVTRLEIQGRAPQPEHLEALLDSGQVARLHEMRVMSLLAPDLERLMAHAPWTHMQRVTLVAPDTATVLEPLAEHQAEFLGRIEQLVVDAPRALASGRGHWLQLMGRHGVGRATGDRDRLAALLSSCGRLRELHLAGVAVRAFAGATHVPTMDLLERLRLYASEGHATDALCSRDWPSLRHLELISLSASAGVARLAGHEGLGAVRRLRLGGPEAIALDVLAGSPLVAGLEHLEVAVPSPSADALLTLLGDPGLATSLRELTLRLGADDTPVSEWLEAAPHFPQVERLQVSQSGHDTWTLRQRLQAVEHLQDVRLE